MTARALILLSLLGAGCSSKPPPQPIVGTTPPPQTPSNPIITFAYTDTLDERPLSSAATRGKPTLVVFGTLGGMNTEITLNYVVKMAEHDADKTNYALVLLEPADKRAMVEIYGRVMKVTFPIALADRDTMLGGGPFGDVRAEPVVVVLDREGRVVFRAEQRAVKSDELRAKLRELR